MHALPWRSLLPRPQGQAGDSMCAQMLVGLCTALQQRPPVFRVTDAVSSAPVTLIGVMHYNPSSVALVWRIDG